MRRFLLGCFAVVLAAGSSGAQSVDATPQPAFVIGQPRKWAPYASALALGGGGSAAGGALALGVRRPIINPIIGMLSGSAEAVGEWKAGNAHAGARLLANAPAIGLGVGADWSVTRGEVDPLFTFETAVRRGGLIGGGSMLRVEWLPTRHQTFALGVQLPLAQPFAGRTRPLRTDVDLPSSRGARTETLQPVYVSVGRALATVAEAATLIRAYNSYWFDDDRVVLDRGARLSYGKSYVDVTSAYRTALTSAFRLAGADSAAERVSTRARAAMLDRVILPYDALFGQAKAQSGIGGLLDDAHEQFARWLSDSSGIAAPTCLRLLAVFDRWTEIVAGVHRQLASQWKDSRVVWLPPALALAPEEYDEQAEVDSLIGRAVGQRFSDDNMLAYLRTADLQLEIARSIMAARKYHVLWTHDYTGRRESGELDDISYTMTADAYLPALTKAVERYDSTGVLTQYFILVDAFYYHGRDGRLWMDVLKNPLDPRIDLNGQETKRTQHIRERVEELRRAVSRSKRLQRDAAENGGEKWLQQVVRVNVNVVFPSDFAFRSIRILPPVPFTPDNIMRDHRKMVIYDITETDPYEGGVIVAGVGVGEHYASVTWEDRGLRLRGPAAVEARAALRRVLRANAFREDQIPPVLRAETGKVAAGDVVDKPRRDLARALHVHNETGFGFKASSVARAMLYSLAPAGSVIIAPDPLWLSETWAAMLAGAAARGSNVAIIAPAAANAPSPQAPILVLERKLLSRLIELRRDIARRANGTGVLHVGVYAANAEATDIAGRVEEVRSGLRTYPWIREMIPFDAQAIAVLDAATISAGRTDASRPQIAKDEKPRKPQLHQKTIFVARPGAIEALVRHPGWEDALARTLRAQAEGTARLSDAILAEAPQSDTISARRTEEMLGRYERSLSEADRKRISFFFAIGNQNHDMRGLALDAEATVIVSGFKASAGLVDLYYLMARTTWIESNDEIDRLVPEPKGWLARFARLIRDGM